MAENSTRAVMDAYFRVLVDRGEFQQFFAPDVTWTTMESGDVVAGRQQVRDWITELHTRAFDARAEIVHLLLGENTAMLEGRFTGTHIGDFCGVAPTGRHVSAPYCMVYELSDGLFAAVRAYFPISGLRDQLTDGRGGSGPRQIDGRS